MWCYFRAPTTEHKEGRGTSRFLSQCAAPGCHPRALVLLRRASFLSHQELCPQQGPAAESSGAHEILPHVPRTQ